MPSIYAGHQIKGPSALLTMSQAGKRQPAMSCLTVAVINIINYKIHWIERSKESKYFHGVPCRWWQNLCKYCPWQIRTPSLYPQTDISIKQKHNVHAFCISKYWVCYSCEGSSRREALAEAIFSWDPGNRWIYIYVCNWLKMWFFLWLLFLPSTDIDVSPASTPFTSFSLSWVDKQISSRNEICSCKDWIINM